jgi:hypothetical protein
MSLDAISMINGRIVPCVRDLRGAGGLSLAGESAPRS